MPDKKSFVQEPLKWNNRCPRAFFGMCVLMFEWSSIQNYVPILEDALNFKRQSARDHLTAIADAALFADFKWEFSIHMAQRFWEAASVNTVNVLPLRANGQEHFPFVADGEQYLTIENDFQPPKTATVRLEKLEGIAANARALYEHWIKPSDYVTNTNLLRHILAQIERCCS